MKRLSGAIRSWQERSGRTMRVVAYSYGTRLLYFAFSRGEIDPDSFEKGSVFLAPLPAGSEKAAMRFSGVQDGAVGLFAPVYRDVTRMQNPYGKLQEGISEYLRQHPLGDGFTMITASDDEHVDPSNPEYPRFLGPDVIRVESTHGDLVNKAMDEVLGALGIRGISGVAQDNGPQIKLSRQGSVHGSDVVGLDSAMADAAERLRLKDGKMELLVRDGIGTNLSDGDRVLEIGTGIEGALARVLLDGIGERPVRFLLTDIDPVALDGARGVLGSDARVEFVQSDLFEAQEFQEGRTFNVILWNPPWYGESRAGKRNDAAYLDENYRTLRRFLKQAPSHLAPGGKIFLIFPRELSEVLWAESERLGFEINEADHYATEQYHIALYEIAPDLDAAESLSADFYEQGFQVRRVSLSPDDFDEVEPEIERVMDVLADEFINKISPADLLSLLRRLSGQRDLMFRDLSPDITLSYLGKGTHKLVYRMDLLMRTGLKLPFVLAVKSERSAGDITSHETNNLKRLNGRGVPAWGGSFVSDDGRSVYIEEFIEGKTVGEYQRERALSRSLKEDLLSTLLGITQVLGGMVPRDIHGENFIVTGPEQRVVMVDIGNKRLSIAGKNATPREQFVFLAVLLSQYGARSSLGEDSWIWEGIEAHPLFENGAGRAMLEDVRDYLSSLSFEDMREVLVRRAPTMFLPVRDSHDFGDDPYAGFLRSFIERLDDHLGGQTLRAAADPQGDFGGHLDPADAAMRTDDLMAAGREELQAGRYWVGSELVRLGRVFRVIEESRGPFVTKDISLAELVAILKEAAHLSYGEEEIGLFVSLIGEIMKRFREGQGKQEVLAFLKNEFSALHNGDDFFSEDQGLSGMSLTGEHHAQIPALLKDLGVPAFFAFDLDMTLTRSDRENFDKLVDVLRENKDAFVGIVTHRPLFYEGDGVPDLETLKPYESFFKQQLEMTGISPEKLAFTIGLVLVPKPPGTVSPEQRKGNPYAGADYYWFLRTRDPQGKVREYLVPAQSSYEGVNKVTALGTLVSHFRDVFQEERGLGAVEAESLAR
ncbi:MAG: methyltransferase, partial [Elusimicrobia bacterium]|nr:methyltransferase [Elusimicrobiota bacterium]